MNGIPITLAILYLCSGIHGNAYAEDPSPSSSPGLDYLAENLGSKAVDILEARGYLVVAGQDRSKQRIIHTQWTALKVLTSARNSIVRFMRLYDSGPEFLPEKGDLDALEQITRLPVYGLLTPGVHASADILRSHLRERAALPQKASDQKKKNFFDTHSGERFMKETHAELVLDFDPLADGFFTRYLNNPETVLHLKAYLKETHDIDAEEHLMKDFLADRMSRPVKSWIVTYLAQQRHLWNIARTARRLKYVDRGTPLKKDLQDLQTLLPAMSEPDSFLEEFKKAVEKPQGIPRANFRATDLHVRPATGGSSQDTGDTVIVSLAYWIEGLAPGENIDVTQTGFIHDQERGIRDKWTRTSRMKTGGPYTFTRELKLDSPSPFSYRFYLSAPEAETFQGDADIGVSADYSSLVSLFGDADSLISRCRLNDAAKALNSVEEKSEELSGKPQFKNLLKDLKDRKKELADLNETRTELKKSLDGVQLHASREHCLYKTEKAEYALSHLKKLPPGCDQLKSASGATLANTLLSQLRLTKKRALLQQGFEEGVAKARELEGLCRVEEAAEVYAASLALLDSDAGSRCGPSEKDYSDVRLIDLSRTGVSSAISDVIDARQAEAEEAVAKGDFPAALGILYPLMSGIDALVNANCHKARRMKAEKAAEGAGIALGPREFKNLKKILPRDPIAKPLHDVRAESRRLRAETRNQAEILSDIETPNAQDDEAAP